MVFFFWHFKFWFAGELSLSFLLVLHQTYYHWEILSYNPKADQSQKVISLTFYD